MNLAAITSPSSPDSIAKIADLAAARGSPSSRKPLSGAALHNASPAEQRTAVSRQFEAILVRQLLNKTMTSMLGSEKSGASANVYGDMLTDSFAQQLTAGSGLGFGKMLEKQLTPRGISAATPPTDTSSTEAHP